MAIADPAWSNLSLRDNLFFQGNVADQGCQQETSQPSSNRNWMADRLEDRNLAPVLRMALDPIDVHRPAEPTPEEQRAAFEARVFGVGRESDDYSDNNYVDPAASFESGNRAFDATVNKIRVKGCPQDQNELSDSFLQKASPQLKEIMTVQQAFSKIKTTFDQGIHPIATQQINNPNVKESAEIFNASLSRNLAIYESRYIGLCNAGVHTLDLINRFIDSQGAGPVLSYEGSAGYSSKEFLEKNLIAHPKNHDELGVNRLLGAFAFDYLTSRVIWGPALNLGAKFGKPIVSKVFQTGKQAGLKAALATKLTGGAMVNGSHVTSPNIATSLFCAAGRGINQYVAKTVGGSAASINHILNAGESGTLAVLEEIAEKAARSFHKVPNLVKKAPKIAAALKNYYKGSLEFLKVVLNEAGVKPETLSGMSLNSIHRAVTTNKLGKVEEKAFRAVQEIISDDIKQPSVSGVSKEESLPAKSQDTLDDLNKVLDSSDNSSMFFENYENFIVRSQIRELFTELDFSSEAIHHSMKKIPNISSLSESVLEESVKVANHIQRTINYCERNNVCEWIKNKLLEILRPFEKHHVFSDKNIEGNWTKRFKKILDKYGLNINGKWNFIRMPHKGKHDTEYHQWCYDNLLAADIEVSKNTHLNEQEQRALLLQLLDESTIIPLKENPLLCMVKWYKTWKNDKLQADSLKSSSIKEGIIISQQ